MLPATWRRYPAETKQRGKEYAKKKIYQNRPEWYDKVCRLTSVARTIQVPYRGHEIDVGACDVTAGAKPAGAICRGLVRRILVLLSGMAAGVAERCPLCSERSNDHTKPCRLE